jgi:hypothetical protein
MLVLNFEEKPTPADGPLLSASIELIRPNAQHWDKGILGGCVLLYLRSPVVQGRANRNSKG